MLDRPGSPISSSLAGRALVALLVLPGCAAQPVPTASTSDVATNSPTTASTGPSNVPTTPAASSLVEVTVEALSIGPAPNDIEDPSVRVLPGTVSSGTRLWVIDETDEWMLVVALGQGLEEATPVGWAATQVEGAPSVGPASLACPPPQLTVGDLVALGSLGGLACYGDRQVELIGFSPLGCGAGGSPRTGTPDWLNGTWTGIGIGNREPLPPDFEVEFGIRAQAAPGSGIQDGCGEPGWYRYVGHFDDPASETCLTQTAVGAATVFIEPQVSRLFCRGNLVLEASARLPGPP